MIVGFTGPEEGMNVTQERLLKQLLLDWRVTELHHGDCIGADAQAHRIAQSVGIEVVGHPPSENRKRAFCQNFASIFPPKPYLKRNWDIIYFGIDALIATPKTYVAPHNLRGQGTWTTVGYAVKTHRRVYAIFPDGSVSNYAP